VRTGRHLARETGRSVRQTPAKGRERAAKGQGNNFRTDKINGILQRLDVHTADANLSHAGTSPAATYSSR